MTHSRGLPGLIDQPVVCSFLGGGETIKSNERKATTEKKRKKFYFWEFYKRVVIWPAACVTYCIIITGQDATGTRDLWPRDLFSRFLDAAARASFHVSSLLALRETLCPSHLGS